MFIDKIGDTVSAVGFFLGILYGTGLIIVTIHLSRYGITNVYLVRTKYLVVGFAYFLHVLGMGILSAPIALALVLLLGLNTPLYVTGPAGILGLLVVLCAGYSPSFFDRTVHSRVVRRFPASSIRVIWYIWYGAIYLSFLLAWHSLIRSIAVREVFLQTIAVCLFTAIFLGGVVYYVLFLYQNPISVGDPALELIGGGRPIQVRLTVKKEVVPSLRKYGLFTGDDGTSEPVPLLDKTEQSCFVLVDLDDKKRALEVSEDIIQSIIYLP
jgi:hypothetical protein